MLCSPVITENVRRQFVARLDWNDLQTLCRHSEFLDALDESIEKAEVVARRLLLPALNQVDSD